MPVASSLIVPGMKQHRLLIIRRSGSKHGGIVWECLCDCGKTCYVRASQIRKQDQKSCGCFSIETTVKRMTKHGHGAGKRATSELKAFYCAKQRCVNPNVRCYKYYGGRGIQFKFESFTEFLNDIGMKPTPTHTLDRINNNGHYEPGNVRWATRSLQNTNKRPSYRNPRSGAFGQECK